ncbi:MAG: hypothetical protein HC772_08275 [Leptolyngbyaceae cyanobacterium CRU_2_3]|nr:hypothetical protein [Leptolyngbyaceae cyanobacterium CRU_2_3]
MELNYFSDHKTEYVAQFGKGLVTEIRNQAPPFDFTYLVGTKNGKTELTLDQLWEMIAQNIFLDLTANFAPYKHSIRESMKVAWTRTDPGGKGFPKCFMSFGLAMIEIPIVQIRASLSNRLGCHLSSWWLNDSVSLPSNLVELVQKDSCQRLRFTKPELLTDLASSNDKSFLSEIAIWINSIRKEIFEDNKLQCTYQGVNFFGPEKGNILQFLDYLQPKWKNIVLNTYKSLAPMKEHKATSCKKCMKTAIA